MAAASRGRWRWCQTHRVTPWQRAQDYDQDCKVASEYGGTATESLGSSSLRVDDNSGLAWAFERNQGNAAVIASFCIAGLEEFL